MSLRISCSVGLLLDMFWKMSGVYIVWKFSLNNQSLQTELNKCKHFVATKAPGPELRNDYCLKKSV